MSTYRYNNSQNRFAALARMGEQVFHAKDLANLWNIKEKNTLYTTLKRYVQRGLLFRVFKGLYALQPVGEIDPRLLGFKALHEYAYVSAETVLVEAGIMQQNIEWITFICSKSKKFTIGENNYWSRRLADKFLFNPAGIEKRNGTLIAIPERAVADLLYFNPKAYLDGADQVNWRKVYKLQKEIGYPLTPKHYDAS